MTTLRELLPDLESEVQKVREELELETEAGELVAAVVSDVENLAMHVSTSVTTLVDAARDKLLEGGVGALQEELLEGATSMGGVSVTVLERKYLIDQLATSRRVLEQLEEDLGAFQV
ncbi:MAG: hypothetical protein NDJ94_06730 [Vicinamibacteria bacterium]|jgi:hypothetical protein|nr:hypothetical protein [Vicinamibacteria bacterium]